MTDEEARCRESAEHGWLGIRVNTGGEDAEAVLERNGLAGNTGRGGVRQRLFVMAATQALAIDQAGAEDAAVMYVLAPDEAVVPVIVPVVLVGLPFALLLDHVVAAA